MNKNKHKISNFFFVFIYRVIKGFYLHFPGKKIAMILPYLLYLRMITESYRMVFRLFTILFPRVNI